MARVSHFVVYLSVVAVLSLTAAGCQQQSSQSTGASFGWKPLFGDLQKDTSLVIARVGDIAITQSNLTQFIDEQPDRLKGIFAGPEGERMALHRMIDQTLMVLGAVDRKLYNDPDVARTLVMQRRLVLDKAMRQYGLLRDAQLTDAQLRDFYDKNIGRYKQLGAVRVRHIECLTKSDAERAYQRLLSKDPKDRWAYVCAEMSVNEKTKKIEGEAGWMNAGGVVPLIDAGVAFSKAVFDLPIGVNPPMKIGDRWQVVEITNRENERNASFEEVKDTVRNDMLPGFQDAIIKDYLKAAREKYGVKLEGKFTPGQGMTAQQLFERALINTDPQRKVDLLLMIVDDYPESDRADDALFLAANTAIESLADPSVGGRMLETLINDYPQSELVSDAKFILENLYNPKFRQPTSIEDLKR